MFKSIGLSTLAVFGLAVLVVSARAGEEKVPLDKVPKPVMAAFKAKFPEAVVNTAVKEEEDGKTVYELESTLNGLSVDAVLKPDGEFVEIEKQIKTEDLPAAVSAAVKAKYPKAAMKKAEEVTADGKTTFEVVVDKGDGKSATLTLDKAGKCRDGGKFVAAALCKSAAPDAAKAPKNCKKGKPCGNTCISMKDTFHIK